MKNLPPPVPPEEIIRRIRAADKSKKVQADKYYQLLMLRMKIDLRFSWFSAAVLLALAIGSLLFSQPAWAICAALGMMMTAFTIRSQGKLIDEFEAEKAEEDLKAANNNSLENVIGEPRR